MRVTSTEVWEYITGLYQHIVSVLETPRGISNLKDWVAKS